MIEGKYKSSSFLTFKLNDETFAANVEKILNILELTKITKVPKAPEYMVGVINLRGNVLPLIDTKVRFDIGNTEFSTNTCILVMDIQINDSFVQIGALVDSVQEVIEIDLSKVEPSPSIGDKYKSDFIEGMAKHKEEFIMLLDMDKIFSSDELSILQETTEEAEPQVETEGETDEELEK
jgi:purine-binding chemotaxis protein CheW